MLLLRFAGKSAANMSQEQLQPLNILTQQFSAFAFMLFIYNSDELTLPQKIRVLI